MIMKHFLLFTLEFPPAIGGVSNYYHNLVRYWGIDRMDVLAHSQKGNKLGQLINGHVFYKKLVCGYMKPGWLPALFHLWLLARKRKTEHVLVGQILPLGIAAYHLSKWKGLEYSVILHGMDFAYALKSPRKNRMTAKILKRADKIICANSYTAKLVNNFDPELNDKTFVVNPGVGIDREPQKELAQKLKTKYELWGKTVVLSLGRLVKRKGFDKMIEVLPRSLEEDEDILYVLAGDGPDRGYLKKKIDKLPQKARKRIVMTGKISKEETEAWMEACDIFAMPSREIDGDFEGFGIVYLEANLAGKPVIAGDSGGVRDAVVDGVNGLLVDPEDIMDIDRKLIRLSKDKKLRDKLGKQGKQRTINEFNWKKQIDELKRIFTS